MAAREFAIGRYWEQVYDAKPTWPTTPNLTDNSLPMFDTFSYAVQAYERVRQYDPTGPLADASLMALGNAYFRHGQFEEAAQQLRYAAQRVSQQQVSDDRPPLGPSGQDARLPGHALRRDAAEGGRKDRRSDAHPIRRQAGRRTGAGGPGAAPKSSKKRPIATSPAPNTTRNTSTTAPPGCTTRA